MDNNDRLVEKEDPIVVIEDDDENPELISEAFKELEAVNEVLHFKKSKVRHWNIFEMCPTVVSVAEPPGLRRLEYRVN